MLSNVTLYCQITMIVTNSSSQLSIVNSVSNVTNTRYTAKQLVGEYCYLLEIPDGHSGLLTFGVLIFGVGGSGFRMFGVSDVGGSVFFFRHSGFLVFLIFGCSGLNPEHKNPECPKIDHVPLNSEPPTPNVRK